MKRRESFLAPCRFCKICAKTPLAPESFYGVGLADFAQNNAIYPMYEPYVCGVIKDGSNYPLLRHDWGDPGDLRPLALEYLQAANWEFSAKQCKAR